MNSDPVQKSQPMTPPNTLEPKSHPLFSASFDDPPLSEIKHNMRLKISYPAETELRKIIGYSEPLENIRELRDQLRQSLRDDVQTLIDSIDLPELFLEKPLPYRTLTAKSHTNAENTSGSAQRIYMSEEGIADDGTVDLGKRWKFRINLGNQNFWDAINELRLVLSVSIDDAVDLINQYIDRASHPATEADDYHSTLTPTVNPPPNEQ